MAGGRAALLQLTWPGEVELVVHDEDLAGSILKKRASAATDLPDRFMKVIGSSSQSGLPFTFTRAASPSRRARVTSVDLEALSGHGCR